MMAKRLRDILEDDDRYLDDMDEKELKCCASLAHHSLLSSFREMILTDTDLSPVPAQHLASLASYVTKYLRIDNVRGCDLVSILTNLKCQGLFIRRQSLGIEETQALVQAMESGVEKVELAEAVTLDIEALVEYSGQGVCRELEIWPEDLEDRYKEELRKWARSKNWRVDDDNFIFWTFSRPGPNENEMFTRFGLDEDDFRSKMLMCFDFVS